MKKNLKGTKTEKNLLEAFAGESMARNKYTFFASKAKKEGYVQISNYFEITAGNEKEHAELWYKYLSGGEILSTKENLKIAANGEHGEWSEMYKRMAKDARDEGFVEIAKKMEGVAVIEKQHEQRYLDLLKNLKDGKVFKRDKEVIWICDNCGHIHRGKDAPKVCPVCTHPQAYFQLDKKDY